MSKRLPKAFGLLDIARPASGFRGKTQLESPHSPLAQEKVGYALYRAKGIPQGKGRELPCVNHGGTDELPLPILGFSDGDHD
jgi:hypothetical protein